MQMIKNALSKVGILVSKRIGKTEDYIVGCVLVLILICFALLVFF